MTPTQIIAKIRERFPELQPDEVSHFGTRPDWSHVLRVLGTYTGIYGDGKVYIIGDIVNCKVDLTKSPEWNIENNTDFASLLERCLTE